MPIELQRRIIEKIVLKRGNNCDTGAIDIGGVFDHLDPTHTLSENISMLESEGFLLPVPFEEMDEYNERIAMSEQKELEENTEHELKQRLWKFYGCKSKRLRPIKQNGK